MGRIIVVSNRLPYTVERHRGALRLAGSIGGLATGIDAALREEEQSVWIGWPGIARERTTPSERKRIGQDLWRETRGLPVFLTQDEIDTYYNGFSNAAIWPLFHYFPDFAEFRERDWNGYRRVNERFARAILRHAESGDTVWIHDYLLLLLPQLLREARPGLSIGFFLHIPFPSSELLREIPWQREILEGMLGADLLGFHTYDYVLHFLQSVQKVLGIQHELGQMEVGTRMVRADAFPLGIDVDRFEELARQPRVQENARALRKQIGDRSLVLSIDRLDYTKGIGERLRAYRELLQRYPAYRNKVTLVLVVPLSRTKVRAYRSMKEEIDQLVGNINGTFGTLDWTPVRYLTRPVDQQRLVSLYVAADIALITPLRDGMNLVAKEYLASRIDNTGVLVLSEMAGAARELSEAVLVNPHFQDSLVRGLQQALRMPRREQIRRNKLMRESLRRRHVRFWTRNFLSRLEEVKNVQQDLSHRFWSADMRASILRQFGKAARPILFLDYDGTLVPFRKLPHLAKPPERVRRLLKRLSSRADIVITTGRSRRDLDRWFRDIPVHLIAEHGAWLKERGGKWQLHQPLSSEWKGTILEILDHYVSSTPGSLVEEKEYSIAWHTRLVDPLLREVRTRDLMTVLPDLIRNFALDVREGHEVVEVKTAAISKGKAGLAFLSRGEWDFIFGVGDDWTDEDLFESLPPGSVTIRVGMARTKAQSCVPSHMDVLDLLQDFARLPVPQERRKLREPLPHHPVTAMDSRASNASADK